MVGGSYSRISSNRENHITHNYIQSHRKIQPCCPRDLSSFVSDFSSAVAQVDKAILFLSTPALGPLPESVISPVPGSFSWFRLVLVRLL